MANAYLDNQSTYIVEVPILEKENQTDKPSILPQFKRNKAQENSKLDEKVEEPKTSEKVEKEKLSETGNSTSNSTLEEVPTVDPVQEKVAKFAESYGMKLENVLFNMDGTIELYLPSGEVIKRIWQILQEKHLKEMVKINHLKMEKYLLEQLRTNQQKINQQILYQRHQTKTCKTRKLNG